MAAKLKVMIMVQAFRKLLFIVVAALYGNLFSYLLQLRSSQAYQP